MRLCPSSKPSFWGCPSLSHSKVSGHKISSFLNPLIYYHPPPGAHNRWGFHERPGAARVHIPPIARPASRGTSPAGSPSPGRHYHPSRRGCPVTGIGQEHPVVSPTGLEHHTSSTSSASRYFLTISTILSRAYHQATLPGAGDPGSGYRSLRCRNVLPGRH